jgi:hypothetical protein
MEMVLGANRVMDTLRFAVLVPHGFAFIVERLVKTMMRIRVSSSAPTFYSWTTMRPKMQLA